MAYWFGDLPPVPSDLARPDGSPDRTLIRFLNELRNRLIQFKPQNFYPLGLRSTDGGGGASGGFLIGKDNGDLGGNGASGNWTVPAGVSSVWVTMIAPGGGGASSAASTATRGGNGGGAGESIEGADIKVTPGGTIAYSIPDRANADADGADASFGFLICKGGKKGTNTGSSGAGGGANGAAATTGAANGTLGTAESNTFFGGASAGGGGTGTGTAGGTGGPAGGRLGSAGGSASGGQAGGGAGASTRYAAAPTGATGGANATDAGSTDYGVGGPGAGASTGAGKTGGKGGPAYLLITYVGSP